MVRLLRQPTADDGKREVDFNPTMVRLLRDDASIFSKRFSSFNPTMVRLLLWCKMPTRTIVASFQSHNGAIAAGAEQIRVCPIVSGFNPTMVRLLLIKDGEPETIEDYSFNPTMVRLLR